MTQRSINNKWKLIYIMTQDIRAIMDRKFEEKDGEITEDDINDMITYINLCLCSISNSA